MTIGSWLESATAQLSEAGIGSPRLDAELLLSYGLKLSREQVLAHPEQVITAPRAARLNQLLKQRSERRPLVHLTGRREFYGLELKITPAVLTPRVETERLVELAIELAPDGGKLLDVGTGSGAIAIAMAKHRPDLGVSASDISSDALQVARKNAKGQAVKVTFIKSNLLEQIEGRFDVITANLPYLPDQSELMPEVTYEPKVALLGGPDGLDLYRNFFQSVTSCLRPNGLVLIEADPWQHQAIAELGTKAGLAVFKDDYFILVLKKSD